MYVLDKHPFGEGLSNLAATYTNHFLCKGTLLRFLTVTRKIWHKE